MNNKQVAEKICARILDLIEKNGALPWVKPWNRKNNVIRVVDGYTEITRQPSAWNRAGVQYKGVNTYLPRGEFITFAQCQKEGGKVKKGATGWPVVYWNFIEKETTTEAGETKKEKIPVLKYYTVFRIEDCEGIKQKHFPEPETVRIANVHYEPIVNDVQENAAAEQVIANYLTRAAGLTIERETGSHQAYYQPGLDYISVPAICQFSASEEFYSTLFHEIAHSTGHESRLNRFTGKAKNAAFGSEEYSKEELVAEMTAASVLNSLGMESANTFRNSAAYIKSWAKHIKENPLTYVSAANKAQAAFDLIIGAELT